MESFLICFYILDHCYFINYESDLGGILGAMSPDLMADGLPIDKAFIYNWERLNEKQAKNNAEILNKVDSFLDYYEKQYGFSFAETRKLLKSDRLLDFVDIARIKACETCNKYAY